MSAESPWRARVHRETLSSRHRSWLVHKIVRVTSMIRLSGVTALAVLALITLAGVFVLQRTYPQQGRTIDVAGARLNVVELGSRDAAGPPIVIVHGASSNLESMRPVGDLLAKLHRVILIDRPGHGWSTRDEL